MRRLPIPYLRCNKATSYAISAIIITAVTATLVMAVALYAYNVLDRQKGAAEFELAKKSILAFDDALQDAAWKLHASRTVRFKIEYGNLQLIPNAMELNVSATIGDSLTIPLNFTSTGFIRYSTSTEYVAFTEGYSDSILGDPYLVITDSTKSLGIATVEQKSNLVDITLSYRVRAMRTSVIQVGLKRVSYVSVWLINVVTTDPFSKSYFGDFDLVAKCNNITTNTSLPHPVLGAESCTINVESEGELYSSPQISLSDSQEVVFTVVVAEVNVGV